MLHTEQLGPYTLRWPDPVFPLCGDSLALGNFATVRSGWRICDLGTGSRVLLLLLAARAERLTLWGFERDLLSARSAQANLEGNGLEGHIFREDLRQSRFLAGQCDLVVSNPPYFPREAGKSGGAARCEEHCTLEELCAAAGRLTRNGGRFALCHRPERLADVVCTLRACRLEPKRMQLVAKDADAPPWLVLVEGKKDARPSMRVLPPLIFDAASAARITGYGPSNR